MSEGGKKDRLCLSDTELLNALELLLRHPGFYDLSLSYDAEERKFYAGWEVGTDLRDVLRTVLTRNRPAGLSLNALLPSLVVQDGHNGNHERELRIDDNRSAKSAGPVSDILVHRTES
ncbi:MAG: hypothetical protein WA324_17365 [Bryobacteraceae bacterium]